MVARRNQDDARLLVRRRGVGTLATSMAEGGAPYASLVTYACDHQGQPIFLFSTLSDHTQNIMADNQASLLVEDAVRKRNPQIGPRLSLMGRIKRDTSPESRARFLARHPDAALYAGFGDFSVYRMTVEHGHYVGGFARAIWFEAKHLLTPKKIAKEIAAIEAGIIEHMNADHGSAVRAYAESLLGRKAGNWQICGSDSDGIDMICDGRTARLDFDKPVTDSNTCREMLVQLATEAKSKT